MIVAMPLAGKSQRFKAVGEKVPKPYLMAKDVPLVKRAIGSIPMLDGCRMEYAMSLEVAGYASLPSINMPPGCWHIVYLETKGPLETLATITGCLNKGEELLVLECDYFMNPKELAYLLKVWRESSGVGGVPVIRSNDPEVSYAAIKDGWVTETREKDVFSEWSTTGPYWFKSGRVFVEAAKKAMEAGHVSISPVYNYVGGKVKAEETVTFRHLGTPEALRRYNEEA